MTGTADRLRAWVPRWWRGEGGRAAPALDLLLYPAEALYGALVRGRNLAFDRGWLAAETAPVPVVSVGNIGIGGAGKTPFAAWLAARLGEWGESPAIVMRGYGRDEVAVHRELNPGIPVIAEPRRAVGARAAAAAGRSVVVLDDAFQHRALRRDLDLLLLPVEAWRERRRLLPRGPWREPAASIARASAVILTRKTATLEEAARVEREVRRVPGAPAVVQVRLAPTVLRPLDGGPGESRALATLRDQPVLAVASLADPAPFVRHLRDAGASPELMDFTDHHDFTRAEALRILDRAGARPIVMTRKEAVKLRSLLPSGTGALVLDQAVLVEEGGELLDRLLRRAIGR